ncbi:MAG: hypothetical protein H7A45_15315 [Verrucomicrobiales bacterium]|nr:hypothetical protein [Verrucomicrobiales bacterium]MCP5528349.1 hypothetical protein [Verrucomicrobiales bacterium]
MDWVDHLLNLAGLLLWLGFRGVGFDRPGLSLAARTLPRPPARFRVSFGLLLVLLLTVRSWVYWRAGTLLDWVPQLNLGVVSIPFNGAMLSRMALFSLGSFGVAWGVFHCGLSYLSLVSHADRQTNRWAAGIARQLGWYARVPGAFKVLIPWLLAAGGWYLAQPGLVALNVALPREAPAVVWQEGAVFGAMTLLVWKFTLVPVLLAQFLLPHAHVGRSAFLDFVQLSATRTLRPFAWFPGRVGEIHFTPALLAALVLVGTWWAQLRLETLFQRLPL